MGLKWVRQAAFSCFEKGAAALFAPQRCAIITSATNTPKTLRVAGPVRHSGFPGHLVKIAFGVARQPPTRAKFVLAQRLATLPVLACSQRAKGFRCLVPKPQ